MKERSPEPSIFQPEISTARIVVADVIGLGILLVIIVLGGHFGSPEYSDWRFRTLVFLALGCPMAGLWHVEQPCFASSKECVGIMLVSIVFGGLFFGVDMVLGHLHHPEVSWLQAATMNNGFAGNGLTMLVCPGTTLMAIASFTRNIFLRR